MENVTAFILAGGKSSRMGVDKGLCKYDDQPFIHLIASCVSSFAKEVILVSDIQDYEVFGLKRIADIYPGKGPIAGIHAALEFTTTDINIIVSCDVPFISKALIGRLLEEDEGQQVIHLATENESMPLIALYKKSTRNHFKSRLDRNALKLKDALIGLEVKSVQVKKDEEKFLLNINTPEQLKEINHGG